MATTRRIVEAELLLFSITEMVLLNRHLHHLKPFSFGERRSRISSQGDMSFIPVPGAATTLQAMPAPNMTIQIAQFADPSGRAI
jgi:hypothetical protein